MSDKKIAYLDLEKLANQFINRVNNDSNEPDVIADFKRRFNKSFLYKYGFLNFDEPIKDDVEQIQVSLGNSGLGLQQVLKKTTEDLNAVL